MSVQERSQIIEEEWRATSCGPTDVKKVEMVLKNKKEDEADPGVFVTTAASVMKNWMRILVWKRYVKILQPQKWKLAKQALAANRFLVTNMEMKVRLPPFLFHFCRFFLFSAFSVRRTWAEVNLTSFLQMIQQDPTNQLCRSGKMHTERRREEEKVDKRKRGGGESMAMPLRWN